jgi:hypothetical protein
MLTPLAVPAFSSQLEVSRNPFQKVSRNHFIKVKPHSKSMDGYRAVTST